MNFAFWALTFVFGLHLNTSYAHAAANPPNENAKTVFLTTENIPTAQGQAHMEVQSFDVANPADLAEAKRQIQRDLTGRSRVRHFFRLNVAASDHLPQASDSAANAVANELSEQVQAAHKSAPQNIQVEAPRSFFKRHYNTTLAIVRFVANTATVSVGLVVGKDISIESALMIGALAGSMSAGIQLKSDAIFKWLSNSVLLVSAAKRLRLIRPTPGEDPSRGERVLKEAEMYGRWATLEAGFLFVCETAMHLLNIPIAENLFLTVAKSTASQGIFEVGVLKSTKALEEMNPELTARHQVFKNVALFAGSGISVLSAVGSLIGLPYANLGFLVLTGTGAVLNFGPKLMRSRPVKQLIRVWRPHRAVRCEAIMAS